MLIILKNIYFCWVLDIKLNSWSLTSHRLLYHDAVYIHIIYGSKRKGEEEVADKITLYDYFIHRFISNNAPVAQTKHFYFRDALVRVLSTLEQPDIFLFDASHCKFSGKASPVRLHSLVSEIVSAQSIFLNFNVEVPNQLKLLAE